MENRMTSQGEQHEDAPIEFANRIGLHFKNQGLLIRAFTHRSYLNEHRQVLEDNERLEFLGDAVLDFLVGAWLFNHFPEMAEGQLTRLRAALVGNQQLAEFARELDIGDAMLLGKGEIENKGNERSGLLGSTFEAVIGAIYLDGGIDAVRAFLEPLLDAAIVQVLAMRRDLDAKSTLQEWSQAEGLGTPYYRIAASSGPDHEKSFEIEVIINGKVYGKGYGSSKQAAAKMAAQLTLDMIGMG
jgi:ribonuclease-3